jgi:hypothetical protein
MIAGGIFCFGFRPISRAGIKTNYDRRRAKRQNVLSFLGSASRCFYYYYLSLEVSR